MSSPSDVLAIAFETASTQLAAPIVNEPEIIIIRLEYVCRNIQNRAAVRLLLACLLAKVHKPSVDIRKPYTQIGDPDCYSGRKATQDDVARAIQKINERTQQTGYKIDNYIFITTDIIDEPVKEYAASIYEITGGIEIVILDCISFVRHFLHLFHRWRMQFLEAYQTLVLAEPESAVSQPLKEAFLALRQAAESVE